jgi:hypothetical protein
MSRLDQFLGKGGIITFDGIEPWRRRGCDRGAAVAVPWARARGDIHVVAVGRKRIRWSNGRWRKDQVEG